MAPDERSGVGARLAAADVDPRARVLGMVRRRVGRDGCRRPPDRTQRRDPLAHIDSDRFLDAQQVRPQVALADGVTRTITWPDNAIHANDASAVGRELVLLSGIEPHYAWRDFCDVLVEVSTATAAQVVVTLGATAAQTPHTRMPMVHASSTNADLVSRFGLHRPRYQGVTGIVGVLHAELDARSIPAISMQVGVPHYASATPNPKAAMALLRFLEHVTGIPTGHAGLAERVDGVGAHGRRGGGRERRRLDVPAPARGALRPAGLRRDPVVRRPRGRVRALPPRPRRQRRRRQRRRKATATARTPDRFAFAVEKPYYAWFRRQSRFRGGGR